MKHWTRRHAVFAAACSAFGVSRRLQAADAPQPPFVFTQIGDGVWMHTSTAKLPTGQWYPSNGMVVVGATRTLLIDTAWTPEQTQVLLGRMTVQQSTSLFITHFHDDRMGGLAVTAAAGIRSFAFARTVTEARAHNMGAIDQALAPDTYAFDLGGRTVEVFYPGPAHTVDNAVAYDNKTGMMFGGCMMRALTMSDMGNVADADVVQWGGSVARVAARYPHTKLIVPGHGPADDQRIYQHTISLAQAKLDQAG